MYRKLLILIALLLSVAVVVGNPWFIGTWLSTLMYWTNAVALWTLDALMALVAAVLLTWARFTRGTPSADLRHLMRHRPKFAALAFGLVLVALTLGIIESTFAIIELSGHVPDEVQEGTYTAKFFAGDPLLGYKPVPGRRVTSIKRVNGRKVYDVVYTIDAAGRRVTPVGPPEPGPTVLFFGGSNTFGEGVNDDETLPHFLARAVPSAAVYNYGFCGYGPQQMLAMLEDGRLDDLVRDRSVIAVYLFIDAHVARAVGSMRVVTGWGTDMPCYGLDDRGQPVRTGSFWSSRPVTNWIYALLSKSRCLRHFNVDIPLLDRSHRHLTARIIEASARRLGAVARDCRFVVAFHPHVDTGADLKVELAGTGVQVLDYAGLWAGNDHDFMIEGDWHPTPLAYQTLSRKLARDLFVGRDDGVPAR